MQHFIRSLVPPIIADFRRQRLNRKTYPSWESASTASRATYEEQALNRFRVDRTLGSQDKAVRHEALLLCAALIGSGVTITDFGGATGQYGEGVFEVVPNARYTVVETPGFTREAQRLQTRVQFVTEMPASCDIFFSSGTLQCLSDPMAFLDRGLASASRCCILARNSFADAEIFRVHRSALFDNGGGTIPPGYTKDTCEYPHRTLIERQVIELANKHGFTLTARFKEESGALFYYGRVYGADLVFLKSR